MTQRDLDRAVSRATGDDVRAIRQRGFSVADPARPTYDPEPYDLPPQIVDWDELERQHRVPLVI